MFKEFFDRINNQELFNMLLYIGEYFNWLWSEVKAKVYETITQLRQFHEINVPASRATDGHGLYFPLTNRTHFVKRAACTHYNINISFRI